MWVRRDRQSDFSESELNPDNATSLRVWRQDRLDNSPQKLFVQAEVKDVCFACQDPNTPAFHERFTPGPFRLVIDVDLPRTKCANGVEFLRTNVLSVLGAKLNCEWRQESLVWDASRADKWSYHVYMPNYYFESVKHCKWFMQELFAEEPAVDIQIYSVGKSLRLPYCTKQGRWPLLLNYELSPAFLDRDEDQQFGMSLCCYFGEHHPQCLVAAQQPAKRNRLVVATLDDTNTSIVRIQRAVPEWTSVEQRPSGVFVETQSCWCPIKQSTHSTPGKSYVVIQDDGAYVLRCHSGQCSGQTETLVPADPNLTDELIVEYMNARNAILNFEGVVLFIQWQDDERYTTSKSLNDFRLLFPAQQFSVVRDRKRVHYVDIWVAHPKRRFYHREEFKPRLPHEPGVLNHWRGFAMQPDYDRSPDEFPLLCQYLHHVICDDNTTVLDYFMGHMARIFQTPWVKTGQAVALRGEMGAGKGFLINSVIGPMIGSKYVAHIPDADIIVKDFNGVLLDKLIVFMDEAWFGGNKKHKGKILAGITEPTFVLNQKYRPVTQRPSFHQFFFASNNENINFVGKRERRMFNLDVNNDRCSDFEFFGAVQEELNDGGYQWLMGLWMTTAPNPRGKRPPLTAASLELRIFHMEPVTQWWFHRLRNNDMSEGLYVHVEDTFYPDGWPRIIVKSEVYAQFKRHDGRLSIDSFGRYFSNLLPPECSTTRIQRDGRRSTAYIFSGLQRMREYFIKQEELPVNVFD